MSKNTLKVANIVYTEDVLEFIKSYFDLPFEDMEGSSYEFQAGEWNNDHALVIQRTNVKDTMLLPYIESDAFVSALLEKFNIDWRPVTTLKFSVDLDSIPVFDIGVFPYVKSEKG